MPQFADMIVGKLSEVTKVVGITASTTIPALQIQYCGPKAYSKVAVTAGDLLFTADDTDGTTADTTIGWDTAAAATGTIDLSTPDSTIDTFGELATIINGFPNWRCFLIGVLPSQLTDTNLVTLSASTACNSAPGVTVYFAVSRTFAQGITGFGYSITNEKFTQRVYGGWLTHEQGWTRNKSIGANPSLAAVNSICYMDNTIAATNAGYIKIYAVDEIDNSQTLIFTYGTILTTATLQSIGTSPYPDAPYVTAPPGKRLVVWCGLVDTHPTAVVMNGIGKTRHLFGGEVPSANYTGCV